MHFTFTLHSSCSTLHTASQDILSQLFLPFVLTSLTHNKLLYTKACTHSKLLHKVRFTQRGFYTEKKYTQQASFYTEKTLILHTANFYAQQAFTQRCFLLHSDRSYCSSKTGARQSAKRKIEALFKRKFRSSMTSAKIEKIGWLTNQ